MLILRLMSGLILRLMLGLTLKLLVLTLTLMSVLSSIDVYFTFVNTDITEININIGDIGIEINVDVGIDINVDVGVGIDDYNSAVPIEKCFAITLFKREKNKIQRAVRGKSCHNYNEKSDGCELNMTQPWS